MYCSGLDVHKKTIRSALKMEAVVSTQKGRFPPTRLELDRWMKTLPQLSMAAMEATMFTAWIYVPLFLRLAPTLAFGQAHFAEPGVANIRDCAIRETGLYHG
jgi:hypothetical protein